MVEINGSNLVRLAVNKLSALFPFDSVIVVIGANSERVTQAVSDLPVKIVYNANWQHGLASSLKAGLSRVETHCRAVMITLCDQALVTEGHLRLLLDQWIDNPTEIAASSYADTVGTPVVIPEGFFSQLLALEGDTGAQSVLKNNADRVRTIPIPEAEFDIDLPADMERLKKKLPPTISST